AKKKHGPRCVSVWDVSPTQRTSMPPSVSAAKRWNVFGGKGRIRSERLQPLQAMPSGSVPSRALPPNALPSRALPSRALPSRALPVGHGPEGHFSNRIRLTRFGCGQTPFPFSIGIFFKSDFPERIIAPLVIIAYAVVIV